MAFYRPSADITIGNWVSETNSTTGIYQSVDESAANDSDFVRSGNLVGSSPDIYKVSLTGTNGQLPCTVRYRYSKIAGSTYAVNLGVRLLQGITAVSSWSHFNIGSTGITASHIVSSGVTDFNNLSLEFTASAGNSGQAAGLLLALTQA